MTPLLLPLLGCYYDSGGTSGPGEGPCWTVAVTDTQELALLSVDPDTQVWQELNRFGEGVESSFRTKELALRGDQFILSDESTRVYIALDTRTGDWAQGGDAQGAAISSDGARIWQMNDDLGGLCTFEDFTALTDETPSTCGEVPLTGVSRISLAGDTVYGVWHSTDAFKVFDTEGNEQSVIGLQDWDDWIFGLSAAGDVLHVLGAHRSEGARFARYDVSSGTLIDEFQLDPGEGYRSVSGLWCE